MVNADNKYEVQPMFIEPLFRTNLASAISEEQIEYLKNIKMVGNQVNLISEDLYIFEDPKLESIKKAVQATLDVYASSIMGIKQKLHVTQSWVLRNDPGKGMHGHSHSNSIVYGSFYFADLPKPSAKMIFHRHSGYQQLEFTYDPEKQNLYNTKINVVEPESQELVLFSSRLQHYVEENTSSLPRFSIAFNSFVRGKIGDFRDVSELIL